MKKLVNYDYVDMTPEEISQQEQDASVTLIENNARIAAEEKKTADKASGNQKLKDLGLTDDEIAALVS
ncbi:MAG: hypothetical protein CL489_05120 [Acidobacteria bacterium]|nr:hypothetical protein [Acidobacteriota bacterium]